MKRIFILLAILSKTSVFGYDNYGVGAKSASMGNASVMVPDVWSVHHNQAGMAFYDKFSLGIHHENRFLIPQYAYQSSLLSLPVKSGVFGFSYSFFGYKLFNEKKLAIAYSRKLIEKLSIGVQMDLINTYLAGYGKENRPCAEIGLMAQPIENVFIGAHVFNVFQTNYSENFTTSYIPTIFRIGAGYHLQDVLMINIEAEKNIDDKPDLKAGIDYHALHGLFIRIGISSYSSQYSFGLGYVYKRIFADIGFTSNRELGFTPHFSMSYEFN